MLLAVFNLKLHLTYPISADNMGAAICAPRHCHPFTRLIARRLCCRAPSSSQTRSKYFPYHGNHQQLLSVPYYLLSAHPTFR